MSAIFTFYSYRDPNIATTMEAFSAAVRNVSEGEFDEEDLDEAKREIIQSLDAPVAPGSRVDVAYSWWKEGKTLAMRQAFRTKILEATCADIQRAVSEHLLPQLHNGAFTTFAGAELIASENKKLIARGLKALPILPV